MRALVVVARARTDLDEVCGDDSFICRVKKTSQREKTLTDQFMVLPPRAQRRTSTSIDNLL
jgi:hypothetical protein